jgi:uncharacterized protein (DUF58 family)
VTARAVLAGADGTVGKAVAAASPASDAVRQSAPTVPLPTARWLAIAASLGVLALPALLVPPAAIALVVGNAIWLALFVLDASRLRRTDWRALRVRREAAPAFSAGRSLPVVLRWENDGEQPVTLRVREEVPPIIAIGGPAERSVAVPAHGAEREELEVRPLRRGKAIGGRLHVRMFGPRGLAWRQGLIDAPWPITVYPNLVGASLRALPTQAQRRREAGQRNVRRIGEGRIFESLREWVPGDDTRTIDWKATARRGKAMSRQYEDERRQQVMIVIDAGRLLTAEVDGTARLESTAEAALHLAYSAAAHDDNVGLMAFADDVQLYVPPARGRRALRAVLDGLASVEGRLVEPNYPAAFAYLAARNRKRALTVLFTDVIDRNASEALLAHAASLRPRHLPLAVTLRNPELERAAVQRPETSSGAFERAAAEELLLEREEALADMRARGVLVVDVPPAGAARAVVEQYVMLKRRGAI